MKWRILGTKARSKVVAGSLEKSQAYNVARASCGEARSLLYVVRDVYPEYQSDSDRLRLAVERVGKCITGLISST